MSPSVAEQDVRDHVGDASFARGREYAQQRMVIRTHWSDGEFTAVVRGTHSEPYRCSIRLMPTDGGMRIRSSACSCPVRSACKHVAAALLHRETGPEPARKTVQADWRSLMPTSRSVPVVQTPLALGVELRLRQPRAAQQWTASPVRAAHPRDLAAQSGELLLGIRPLMRSDATGAWIRGDASWDTVRRPQPRFSEAHRRWFSDLLSIARDSLLSGTAGDWILLDHVESALLWPHLEQAAALGISVVATQQHTDVTLGAPAAASMKIVRTDDEGLRITVDITVDDTSADGEVVRSIGHVGVYRVRPQGARLSVLLAPVELSAAVHSLLARVEPMTIPRSDVEAFYREAAPLLVRSGPVIAGPGVTLPEPVRPSVCLAVRFRPGDIVEYRFEWEYLGHGRFAFDSAPTGIRDASAEATALAMLASEWLRLMGTDVTASGIFTDVDAAEFIAHVVPALEEQGVTTTATGRRRRYHELTGDPQITVSSVESTDADWFDLGVLVKIDGKPIPFTPLFTALSMRRTKLLLVDGSYLSLAHPALQRLRELIDEAGTLTEWEAGPRISRHQIALWEEFEDLADQAQPAVSWRAAVDGLRAATTVPAVKPPAGLHAELRPYQRSGFEWLAFLWEHRLGGILADDMGLGKTMQLLALMLHAKQAGERRPFLVVAPTSVLVTWREEAARFAPGLRVHVIESTSAKRGASVAAMSDDADLVVTSYTLVRLDESEFTAIEWAGIILDEAQFVKNPAAGQHRAVAALRGDVTFAVTGTPMENTLADLWALFQLTAPGLFPSARTFRQDYIQPIERGKVPENEEGSEYRQRRLDRLRRRIRPLMLRRTKELVAPDLPPKQEQLLYVELSPAHRALYDTVLQRERQKVLGLLADLDRNRFIVFRSLTMLRMLALSPDLIDQGDATIGSRKLDALIERVVELHAEGHRALVFSQFTSFLDMAGERLRRAGLRYAHLDGATRNREQVVDDFRSGDQPVFLISLKAGGFGLTLTEADYVFLLDPWWNPAAEAQAVDRTHRIGQENPVMVYRMIATATIEEKVLALQERKARLFTAVVDDGSAFAQALTADDIRGLFEE